MPDEEVQELGREGVGMVKAWLESTTWIRLPMNSYEDRQRCIVAYPGGRKKFDLAGNLAGNKHQRRNLWVESKRYASPGAQHREFQEFLSIAYAYTRKQIDELGSCDDEFMWVTSHPFFVDGWPELTSEQKLRAAVQDGRYGPTVDADDYDEHLGRDVASRIWILVWSEKQISRLSLSSNEIHDVLSVLKREGDPLWHQ